MNYSKLLFVSCLFGLLHLMACKKEEVPDVLEFEWVRDLDNPVFRDLIPTESYQSASDPHVFFDDSGALKMIYSGDVNGKSSIKLATGTSWNSWTSEVELLAETGPSGVDGNKETAFYRKSNSGKHQIYYIGYENGTEYQAQIFLAEADDLTGPYLQMQGPVVSRGMIAGETVYCMTSPSVVEHEDSLYLFFIGWDAAPSNVTEVWIIGATSTDEGHSWSDFQIVDTPIGMEGQITKTPDDAFVAVRTGDYQGTEAIIYSTAGHPLGPWKEQEKPLIVKSGAPFEVDEIIAPQITYDVLSDEPYLFYTGADYDIGWWVMLAKPN